MIWGERTRTPDPTSCLLGQKVINNVSMLQVPYYTPETQLEFPSAILVTAFLDQIENVQASCLKVTTSVVSLNFICEPCPLHHM